MNFIGTPKTTSVDPLDKLIFVQFCPCGHVYQMRRCDVIDVIGHEQLDEIAAGKKLDAPILPSMICLDCKEERYCQERLNRELDLDAFESAQRCWTCHATGVPLSGWGPFCSTECQRTADLAAEEAAENR